MPSGLLGGPEADEVAALTLDLAGIQLSASSGLNAAGQRIYTVNLSVPAAGPGRVGPPLRGEHPLRGPGEARADEEAPPEAAPQAPAGPGAEEALAPPAAVLALAGYLGAAKGASPEDRVSLAWRLGRSDAAAARGERPRQEPGGQRVGGRPACYAILAGPPVAPCWVADYRRYWRLVGGPAGFDPTSVSRAFASQVEGRAYFLGAGLQGFPDQQ